jgi:hypothetical protein
MMGRRTAVVDRLIVGLVALLMIGAGVLVIGWRRKWTFATDMADRIDLRWFAQAPDERLWPAAMFVIAVTALVFGLVLLTTNLARHRIGPAMLSGSDEVGSLSVDLGALAGAIAEDLQRRVPGVVAASAHAILERGQPTIPIRLTVDPRSDLRELVRAAELTAHQVTHALDGADVAIRVSLVFERAHP